MSNLYIVGTPIGNLQDITLRAASLLLSTDVIISESTSKTGILLEFLKKTFPDIKASDKKIISLTEDEEELKLPSIIKILEESDAVLTCEAGTPLVSDPGYKLVREAIKRGINVIPVPGASAVIAGVSASGLPTDKFFFLGFLPKTGAKKEKVLLPLKDASIKTTVVLYESPQRLVDTLETINNVFGDVDCVIARELTKVHEEFARGKVKDLISSLKEKGVKGEITILFSTQS